MLGNTVVSGALCGRAGALYQVDGMTEKPSLPTSDLFRRFSTRVADLMGTPAAFFLACFIIVAWACTGPLYGFSDTWQIVINTGTTIVTFLMVFILQTTQNRDARALHLKLDELIRAKSAARNSFADLQNATDEEIAALQLEFSKLRKTSTEAMLARVEVEVVTTTSIANSDEALAADAANAVSRRR